MKTKNIRLAGMTALCIFAARIVFAVPPNVKTPPLDFKPGQVERVTLKNGAVVYLMEDHELPLFDLNIRMKTSPADEAVPESFDFLGTVWRAGGTKTRKPEQLNEELEHMAASVETSADNETAVISLSCMSKDLSKGLDILSDVLFNPMFDQNQLTIAKNKTLEEVRRKNETPAQISRRAFRDMVYGKDHVYAQEPTEKNVTRVTRADIVALYKKVVAPDQSIISVSGDFDKAELLSTLETKFSSWTATGRSIPPYDFSVKHANPGTLFFVEKEATQSRVTVAHIGVARHNPDHFSLELADYILGGGGPSRLFGEVRSRRGLAYVVGSFVQEPAGPGLIGVVCQTKTGSTIQAVQAIYSELDKFSTGPISDDEIRTAKDSTINSFVFGFDSPWELVNARASNEFYGYPPDYPDTYTQRIEAVSKEEIHRVAKKYFSNSGMKTMVVGDEKNLDAPLDKLGSVIRIPLADVE